MRTLFVQQKHKPQLCIFKKGRYGVIKDLLNCSPMFLFFNFDKIEGISSHTKWDPLNDKKCPFLLTSCHAFLWNTPGITFWFPNTTTYLWRTQIPPDVSKGLVNGTTTMVITPWGGLLWVFCRLTSWFPGLNNSPLLSKVLQHHYIVVDQLEFHLTLCSHRHPHIWVCVSASQSQSICKYSILSVRHQFPRWWVILSSGPI